MREEFARARRPSQPVEEVLRWRERDQIRQIKEPDRRHIPEIRRDSAMPSWRIWAARSPNDFFNRLLGFEVLNEPVARRVRHGFQCAGLLEEVTRTLDDDQVRRGPHFPARALVQTKDLDVE